MSSRSTPWTNSSVVALAGSRDPVEAIAELAQQTVLEAMEKGWSGPPFDPFELARILRIPLVPRQDLADARTVPIGHRRIRIEYNPTRPTNRLRFSIAHEIAHSLFPDVAKAVRHRGHFGSDARDSWQLELLCNVAAGELLMPTQTLGNFDEQGLDLHKILELRSTFGVSTEAMLRRVAKLTSRPVAMFAASRLDDSVENSAFRLDYTEPSRTWKPGLSHGLRIKRSSVLGDCSAIGFTARREENWAARKVFVQAVGVPPFPGHRHPRVLGLLQPEVGKTESEHKIDYLFGDATLPRGDGPKLIAHVVNDKTPNWGGAFARVLRSRYPMAQEQFRSWAQKNQGLTLGTTHHTESEGGVGIVTMVAQHGYGPSKQPRIRYVALHRCLRDLGELAIKKGASVHMPRIGAGMAGGRWSIVRELVDSALCRRGVDVFVYALPGEDKENSGEPQQALLTF